MTNTNVAIQSANITKDILRNVKPKIHGIYRDGKEYCSVCNEELTVDWSDYSPALYCDKCNVFTIEVTYPKVDRETQRAIDDLKLAAARLSIVTKRNISSKDYVNIHDYDSFTNVECQILIDRRNNE